MLTEICEPFSTNGPIGYSLRFITGGLFIIFISWIMNMGKKLEDEQKYTV